MLFTPLKEVIQKERISEIRKGNHRLMIETGRCDQIPRGLIDSALLVDVIDLKIKFTYFSTALNGQFLGTKFKGKIEYHLPNIKQLPPTQVTKELINSANYYVNTQVTKFFLLCFDLRNNLSFYQIRSTSNRIISVEL